MVSCPILLLGQDAEIQLKFGVSGYFKEPGITLQINRALGESRFKISGNYHRIWANATTVFNMYSTMVEYSVFRSKDKKYQGFSLGFGPGYTYSTIDRNEYLNGPGMALKLEYQRVLKNNWYYGAEMFALYFANQNEMYGAGQGKLKIMPFNLTIGFIPRKVSNR